MSTAVNHRKRSHRSEARHGYAASSRKRMAAAGQDGLRGFGLFRGIFHSRAREKGSAPHLSPAATASPQGEAREGGEAE